MERGLRLFVWDLTLNRELENWEGEGEGEGERIDGYMVENGL